MVGDDHTRSLGQALASLDPQSNARAPQEPSSGQTRDPAAPAQAGNEQIDHERGKPQRDEQPETIGRVRPLQERFRGDFCDLVLLMLILPVYCETGHADPQAPLAYCG